MPFMAILPRRLPSTQRLLPNKMGPARASGGGPGSGSGGGGGCGGSSGGCTGTYSGVGATGT